MAIFWHNKKEQTNYLIHASERQILVNDHPLKQVKTELEKNSDNIKNNTIFVYSAVGYTLEEEIYIQSNLEAFTIITNLYNYYYIIGLDFNGNLIDKYSVTYCDQLINSPTPVQSTYDNTYKEEIYKVSILHKDCNDYIDKTYMKGSTYYYDAYKYKCGQCNYKVTSILNSHGKESGFNCKP